MSDAPSLYMVSYRIGDSSANRCFPDFDQAMCFAEDNQLGWDAWSLLKLRESRTPGIYEGEVIS